MQRSLGGHAIPLDPPTLRCCRRLGLVEGNVDDLESARATLEHLIPKAKGPQAASNLSVVALEYCHDDEPRCQSCPMAAECAFAQEQGVDQVPAGAGASRGHRPKPR